MSLADEAANSQTLFAMKAAERRAKADQKMKIEEEQKKIILQKMEKGLPLIEGELLKKTGAGKWNMRKFSIIRNEIIWLRSDNKSNYELDLAVEGCSVRDIKIGVKKFMFEISIPPPGFNLMLAASNEEERKNWIEYINLAINTPKSLIRIKEKKT